MDILNTGGRGWLRGGGGKHNNRLKSSPFSPENFPLPIKYLIFDYKIHAFQKE